MNDSGFALFGKAVLVLILGGVLVAVRLPLRHNRLLSRVNKLPLRPSGPFVSFTTYLMTGWTESKETANRMSSPNRNFRRATQPGGAATTYLFCQQKNGAYSMPTDYGYISYNTPASPTQEMLGEMDAIIGMIR